jgi:putative transposase
MARIARIVVPGVPHHVTQRGNRGESIFFEEDDYALYRDLLAEGCAGNRVAVWSYCLMPNHVHLIMVPAAAEGLARALGEAHRRYTGYINARHRVTGHLFQGRFGSVAMDEPHLLAAARYVALNPVSARLVKRARDWRWSSVRAHLAGKDDVLTAVRPLLDRIPDFAEFLRTPGDEAAESALLAAQTIGRPLMAESAVRALERRLERSILPRKRGPKRVVGVDKKQIELP